MIIPITSILGVLLIGAISPGPSFVLVARTSIAVSRLDGLASAFGMGVGGVVFGGLALLGLQTLFAQVEWLYFGFKLLGGCYLLYLGVRLWRGAADPIVVPETAGHGAAGLGRSFSLALATQLSNPKTVLVYGSVFAALLPDEMPLSVSATLLPLILLVETCWYAVVAVAFSSDRPRAAYLRMKTWIDRVTGSIMGILGLRLILEKGQIG